jgi:hypothetical protein
VRQERHLQRAFPLNVLMVLASVLNVAAGGEGLLCGGFSRGKTIRFESLEFIADHFGSMSLSPMWDGSNTVVMDSARGGPLPLCPHSGPRLGTPSRGSPWPRTGNGGPTSPLLGGTRGGHSRFNHDHTTAGELSDRSSYNDQFHRGRRRHGRTPTSPSSDGMLVGRPHNDEVS